MSDALRFRPDIGAQTGTDEVISQREAFSAIAPPARRGRSIHHRCSKWQPHARGSVQPSESSAGACAMTRSRALSAAPWEPRITSGPGGRQRCVPQRARSAVPRVDESSGASALRAKCLGPRAGHLVRMWLRLSRPATDRRARRSQVPRDSVGVRARPQARSGSRRGRVARGPRHVATPWSRAGLARGRSSTAPLQL